MTKLCHSNDEHSWGATGDDTSGGDVLALGVRGYSCQVFDDPETAWKLHKESHLIAWRGESDGDLRVDRFDARNLLEDRSLFRQLKKRKRRTSGGDSEAKAGASGSGEEGEETEQQKLHRLRFGDYSVEFPPSEETFAAENKFAYQYPEDGDDQESDGEVFEPQWAVPDSIVLPKTKKRHAILEATANKVRGNPQLEIMLKVKLSENVKFRFLDPSHALHAYYCFLRDENPQPVVQANKLVRVSLLGDEYDQDSEEEGEEHTTDMDANRELKSARHHH
ncbi:Splicing factor [Phytophthora cinnamomi]|uniref:Splicing factor n=1 Tax=Phytophthora cinnamomi TaxID=4785 RepID=UPI00355988A2|nr:Splicing factor [Phytophthora cinnamomi]